MPCSLLDRFADLGLGGFAESGQFRDAAGFASFAQLLNGADVELVVERFDLFRPEAGNREQLQNRGWKFRA